MSNEYLRPGDIAAAWGVDTKTIRNWERSGRIPPAQRLPSGYRRWRADVIAKVMRAHGVPVPEAWGVKGEGA